jgi:hypothetical protein
MGSRIIIERNGQPTNWAVRIQKQKFYDKKIFF